MSDIIDYRPIRTMLEEARNERVNGYTQINKEDQAIVDHIDAILEGYDRILEDLDSDGLADVSAELDELSNQAVDILTKIGLVDTVDAADLVSPIPLTEMEIESDDEDEAESEDE